MQSPVSEPTGPVTGVQRFSGLIALLATCLPMHARRSPFAPLREWRGVRVSGVMQLTAWAAVARLSRMTDHRTSIGQRVRWAREGRAWTRTELADRAGVNIYWLTSLELRPPANPGIENVQRLAAAFGMTVDELLSYEPEAA